MTRRLHPLAWLLVLTAACSRVAPSPEHGLTPQSIDATYVNVGGGSDSAAYGVGAVTPVIVGTKLSSDEMGNRVQRGFIFRPGSVQGTLLGTLGGGASTATATTAHGVGTVGYAQTADGETHAVSWSPGGDITDLGTLGGPNSYASSVAGNGGTVAGSSDTAAGTVHAFLRRLEAGSYVMRDLGTLGGPNSYGYDLSADLSAVVGASDRGDGRTHAFIWTDALGVRDLGTLGGTQSRAYGVSDDGGTVVGSSTTAAGLEHAFVWTAAGGMSDLGTLGGGESVARAVSADGSVVVGSSTNAAEQERAFYWTLETGLRDLGTLGGDESSAYGVSADGTQIVGWSDTVQFWRNAALWRVRSTPQTITFELSGFSKTLGEPPFTLPATASSGLPVTLASDTTGVCAASGTTVTLLAAGTCTLSAAQAGNLETDPAETVTQSFTVYPAPPAAKTFLLDFETAPVNRILYRAEPGAKPGLLNRSEPPAQVLLVGKRRSSGRILQAQLAKVAYVYGSRRLIVSSPNANTPHLYGGRLKLDFRQFGPQGVTLTSLTLSNLTTNAYLSFYYADGSSSRQALPRTAAKASVNLPLRVSGLRALDIFSPVAFAVDNVSFTGEVGN